LEIFNYKEVFMDEILSQIIPYIPELISFLAGTTLGSLVTFRLTKNRASFGGKIVDQSNAQAGKDIVGGNKSSVKK
jgi:hypothetical protein